MHRSILSRLLLLAVLSTAAAGAFAHHSIAGQYVSDEVIVLEGEVTDVSFRNPHVHLYIDVVENGEISNWGVGLQNVAILRRIGVNRDTFAVGDRVKVTGNPGKDNTPKIYVIKIQEEGGDEYAMFRDGTPARAANEDAIVVATSENASLSKQLQGDWSFEIDKRLPGSSLRLQFEKNGGGVQAVLDSEAIDVGFAGAEFVLLLHRENAAGSAVTLQLTGQVDGDQIAGDIEMIAGATNLTNLDAMTFTATRSSPEHWDRSTPEAMQPVDLSGIWRRTIGVGPLGRTNPQLNAAGQARHEDFMRSLYDPALRCLSVGPMRKYADPGSVEILPSTNRLTFLYASGHDVRRIYFDRDQHNDERDHDVMGESLAHWDGATLVIDTRSLSPTVITHNSEPTSENARIVERYWLEDNGDLTMEARLHDPEYLERPVVRRTQWRRTENQQQDIIYGACDPDSHYQTMFHDGALPKYFENRPE